MRSDRGSRAEQGASARGSAKPPWPVSVIVREECGARRPGCWRWRRPAAPPPRPRPGGGPAARDGRPGETGGSASCVSVPGGTSTACGGAADQDAEADDLPARAGCAGRECSRAARRPAPPAAPRRARRRCRPAAACLDRRAAICSASRGCCCATASRSSNASALNQVLATEVTTVSATVCWSKRLNSALASALCCRRAAVAAPEIHLVADGRAAGRRSGYRRSGWRCRWREGRRTRAWFGECPCLHGCIAPARSPSLRAAAVRRRSVSADRPRAPGRWRPGCRNRCCGLRQSGDRVRASRTRSTRPGTARPRRRSRPSRGRRAGCQTPGDDRRVRDCSRPERARCRRAWPTGRGCGVRTWPEACVARPALQSYCANVAARNSGARGWAGSPNC